MKKLNFVGELLRFLKKVYAESKYVCYIVNTFVLNLHIIYGTSRGVGGKNMIKTSDLNILDIQMAKK